MSLARHDVAFLLLGLGTAAWLGGAGPTLEVCGVTLAYGVLIHGLRRGDGALAERAALLLAYGYALWFYWAVERIHPALGGGTFDGALLAADQWLGATPSIVLQGWVTPFRTDLLSLAYASYLPYLHGVCLWELWWGLPRARALAARLYPAFALGYLGYLVVPARGPRVAFPELYEVPLGGGMISEANAAFMEAGSPGVDVFPSLHVLITLVLWTHDWRHARSRAWCMLPVVVLLVLSTVYLRYHYAIDLLAAVVVWAVVEVAASDRRPLEDT